MSSESKNTIVPNTKVVCVKVAHIRPKYKDLREWMQDPNNVYIARKGIVFLSDITSGKKIRFPPQDSLFANPFTVKQYGLERAISLYREHLQKQIKEGKITASDLENLKGKNLGCWCDPGNPCHGHVLLEILKKHLFKLSKLL